MTRTAGKDVSIRTILDIYDFCDFCDYGPLGYNQCPSRVDSREERKKQGYCGYGNCNGLEITNTADKIIIHKNSGSNDVEIPKANLLALKTEINKAIQAGVKQHRHPNQSIVAKLFEKQEANV